MVMKRKIGEEVICEVPPSTSPTLISIMVTDILIDSVKLGFTAPKECPVHRREVHERIQIEGRRGK